MSILCINLIIFLAELRQNEEQMQKLTSENATLQSEKEILQRKVAELGKEIAHNRDRYESHAKINKARRQAISTLEKENQRLNDSLARYK